MHVHRCLWNSLQDRQIDYKCEFAIAYHSKCDKTLVKARGITLATCDLPIKYYLLCIPFAMTILNLLCPLFTGFFLFIGLALWRDSFSFLHVNNTRGNDKHTTRVSKPWTRNIAFLKSTDSVFIQSNEAFPLRHWCHLQSTRIFRLLPCPAILQSSRRQFFDDDGQ